MFDNESVRSSLAGRRATYGLVCAWLWTNGAAAQAPPIGVGSSALPGYFRVPVVAAAARGASVAGGVGYGFTESQSTAPGSHHRVLGRISAGITPARWLGFGLGTNLRHDRHPADALGADRGTVVDSDASLLAGVELPHGVHVGGLLSSHFSRGDDIGRSLSHPAIDLAALAAYLPEALPLSVGLMLGYRVDRSGGLLARADEFREGDRLALEVSDFDALTAGVGASCRLQMTELLAELSGDVLVGDGAPPFRYSPLRASVGARQHLSSSVSLRIDADASLSARRSSVPGDPLYPIEPRFQVAVGMAYSLFDWEPAAAAEPEPPPLRRPAPARSSLVVNVTTRDGHPLSDARVELARDAGTASVPHEYLQRYGLAELPAGEVELRVSAERLVPVTRTIQLRPGESLVVDVQLDPAAPSGQIRGLIRSFEGKGLAAHIRVEPLGTELATDAAGTFSVDVPPGRYDVVIEASGHGRQTRRIEVADDGVVIINADLRRAP